MQQFGSVGVGFLGSVLVVVSLMTISSIVSSAFSFRPAGLETFPTLRSPHQGKKKSGKTKGRPVSRPSSDR